MANQGSDLELSYKPPRGKPLGSNPTWKFWARILIPIVKSVSKAEWRGAENIPANGPMIAISNHISYFDPLVFAHFLYGNGRAVRFLGKASLFRVPLVGWVLRHAEQVPVEREVKGAATVALPHAVALLEAGHCLGVYPEGTLTRDADHWPMVAKTGLARLAVTTRVPVIPCAQWGAVDVIAPYSKKPKLWPRTKIQVIAGKPLDFSRWYGKEDDHEAMVEATAYAMDAITTLLEEIRGEKRPENIFDPRKSDLPRVGNYKKRKEK